MTSATVYRWAMGDVRAKPAAHIGLVGLCLLAGCISGCDAYREGLLSRRSDPSVGEPGEPAEPGVPGVLDGQDSPDAGRAGAAVTAPDVSERDDPDSGAGHAGSGPVVATTPMGQPDTGTDDADAGLAQQSERADASDMTQADDAATSATPDGSGAADATDAATPEVRCAEWLPSVIGDYDACITCACQRCADDVLRCFDSGETSKDALCVAVLDCSVQNGCAGFDCYCADSSCGWAAGGANGPCALQIEAAANGKQQTVADQTDAQDQATSLGRVNAVLSCMADLHPSTFSSGQQVLGGCREACGWRTPL